MIDKQLAVIPRRPAPRHQQQCRSCWRSRWRPCQRRQKKRQQKQHTGSNPMIIANLAYTESLRKYVYFVNSQGNERLTHFHQAEHRQSVAPATREEETESLLSSTRNNKNNPL
ncbi:hypothetical protein D917_04303 [Trichinella nativa]|uniref:Uncharacterized protein n=1 Tax=Trichinella nativa TaxID=6335 RepID=A0A1Y3E5B3_9BILA|nr:hypothetical protein D917_04303 [Trichinella nativa]